VEIADRPYAYIIPQGWVKIIDRLKWNSTVLKRLSADFKTEVNVYYIEGFETADDAFEGHYIHSKIKVRTAVQKLQFFKGDYVVFPNQYSNKYIIEMLEPQGVDSYFAWNFFDPILMQKEYFSDYVWEDLAADLLKDDPNLKSEFEQQKKDDPDFAKNGEAQLRFIYNHSQYFETSFKKYPVARVMQETNLPVE
jgi:hypothetical protein